MHSLTITIGAPSVPYDLTIILVLEEGTLTRDREITEIDERVSKGERNKLQKTP